jgi:hypothetical protein
MLARTAARVGSLQPAMSYAENFNQKKKRQNENQSEQR